MSLIFIPPLGASGGGSSPALLIFTHSAPGTFELTDAGGAAVAFTAPLTGTWVVSVNNVASLMLNIDAAATVAITSDATSFDLDGAVSEITLNLSEITELTAGQFLSPATLALNTPLLTSLAGLDTNLVNGSVVAPNLVSVVPSGTGGSLLSLTITGAALSEASVDDLIIWASASTNNNGTLDLSGGTSAAPTATSVSSLAILITNGWTVTTN